MLGTEPGIESTERVDVGREGRGRRWGVLAGVLVVALVGAGLVLGGDDGGDDEPAAERDRRTTTSRAPRSTTTSIAPPVTAPHGPQLPTATGLGLLVVSGAGQQSYLDLDTGTHTPIERRSGLQGDPYQLQGVRGGVVALTGTSATFYPMPEGEPVNLGGATQMHATPGADELWLVVDPRASPGFGGDDDDLDPPVARLVGLDGERRSPDIVLSQGWVNGATSQGLVLVAGGNPYLVERSGDLRPLGDGNLLAAGGDHVVLERCDAQARCALDLLNITNGAERRLEIDLPDAHFGYEVSLSEEGELALIVYRSSPMITIGSASGNQRAQLEGFTSAGRLQWLPGGHGLLGMSTTSHLERVRLDGDTAIREPIPALRDLSVNYAIVVYP